ncbi:MAG: hypothetical protein AVDCRST_MAG38-936, partial [uncultured Solirubrobacteraceae bacterium]
LGLRAPQRDVDLPHLRALRAAAGVHDPGRGRRGGGARGVRALSVVLLRRRGRRPCPVADPRLDAVRGGGPARGPGGHRRHPGRQPRASAAGARAGPARRAPARGRALSLRAGAGRYPGERPERRRRRGGPGRRSTRRRTAARADHGRGRGGGHRQDRRARGAQAV